MIQTELPRKLLDKPSQGDGTSRHGYGLEVAKISGMSCAYCDMKLDRSYHDWLHVSVEHIVPISAAAKWDKDGKEWVEDMAN